MNDDFQHRIRAGKTQESKNEQTDVPHCRYCKVRADENIIQPTTIVVEYHIDIDIILIG